jgi:hypothetical protein
MTVFSLLPFAAAALGVILAIASGLRRDSTPAPWFFAAGMLTLALDGAFAGLGQFAGDMGDLVRWLTLGLAAKSFLPAAWLGFSVTYARQDYRSATPPRKVLVALLAGLPIGLAVAFNDQLFDVLPAGPEAATAQLHFSAPGRLLNTALVLGFVVALVNLEQTFRAAVGTARWRIKFVVLGLAVILGGHVYVRSQAILYSAHDPAHSAVEPGALLIGGVLLAIAYAPGSPVSTCIRPVPSCALPSRCSRQEGTCSSSASLPRSPRDSAARRVFSSRPLSCSWGWRAWHCCCSPIGSGSAYRIWSDAISASRSTTPSRSGRGSRGAWPR